LLDGSAQENPVAQQVLASTYPGSGVTISIISDNTAVGTVSPGTVTIAPGTSSATTTFTPVTGSSTNPYATANVKISATPSGFTTTNSAYSTIQAEVTWPSFSINPSASTVGQFLQTGATVGIAVAVPANDSPLVVNLQASGNILLSTTGTDGGFPSIQLQIAPGSQTTPTYFIYGLGSSGTASYTASFSGGGSGVTYNPKTSTVTLAPSGVALAGTYVLGSTQELLTSASDNPSPYGQPTFTVEVGILNADGSFFGAEPVMGGLSVTANLNLNGPGTLGTTQVTIPAGSYNATVSYTPPTTVPSPNSATITLGQVTDVTQASTQSSITVVIEP
jgi:hypothetical protein